MAWRSVGSLPASRCSTRFRDASKVALVHLVVVMNRGGGNLLDVQWQTPHLESLGAVVIGRDAYMGKLEEALSGPDVFEPAYESDSL